MPHRGCDPDLVIQLNKYDDDGVRLKVDGFSFCTVMFPKPTETKEGQHLCNGQGLTKKTCGYAAPAVTRLSKGGQRRVDLAFTHHRARRQLVVSRKSEKIVKELP